ncbi:MAG: Trm112 family protein [Desulfobulbaceae bacterium]|nr:Trm112 family protein [Desulfobulbaceae bacterium]
MIKQELLDIIACPKCKGPVQLNEEKNGLICKPCQLVYEIRDNIPIMLIDEATPLHQDL